MDCADVGIADLGLVSARRRGYRSVRLMVSCGVAALVVVALLAVHVSMRAEVVAASARRSVAQARLTSLMNEYDRACLELARVTSLDRVEVVARTLLDMTEPGSMQVVLVDGIARPQNPVPAESARLESAPQVLAGVSGVVQQLVGAAVSNLVAAWFASPPPSIPSVLR